ncbi:hypothetical protein IKG54_00090, partial [Candidatus Saccharibacteria bacterium]|nr:hypothetical protein [Candidatus Saccharibacteria bacterium]
GTCTNPSINLDSDNYLYVTCTTPVLSEGVYTVELTLTNLGRVLTAENVVTYSGDPLDGIETMQTFTAAACNRLPEADTAGNNIYTLKDSRDNKSYKIAHLADGNCWMVQNLALDGGRTLTPADSNVTQNRTLPANIANGVAPSYNDSQIYAGVQNQTDVYGSKYGNLYNYPASSATLGNFETLSTITESVCPKNWRLPDNSNYNTLIPLYYSEQDSIVEKITKLQNLPLSIPLPGRYDSTYYNSYEVGFYIARTVPSDNIYGVYSLLINNISAYTEINTLRIANKNWGMSVRCVFDS